MNVPRLSLAILVFVLAGVGGLAQERSRQDSTPAGPVVGRSIVATTFGIVAASQPLAARAGVQILERGGNAIETDTQTAATHSRRRACILWPEGPQQDSPDI